MRRGRIGLSSRFCAVLVLMSTVFPTSGPLTAGTIGADVIVGELTGPGNFGSAGSYYAYSVGTTSCNQGDELLEWIASTNHHPVIAQHLYRLKDGRFEQIGISWLKHGFTALQGDACSLGCTPSGSGSFLGIGCSDPYGAGLNASQGNGPRSEINASTGLFPYPYVLDPPVADLTSRRIRVHEDDLDPALNVGAQYFIEGHYVALDDATAGNHHNNASYREVSVSPTNYNLSFVGSTQRQLAAIEAWPAVDPTVTIQNAYVDAGRFILATKVTDLGNGFWEYEYALHNLSSDRSGQSFSVPIGTGVLTQNPGFHDVDYHSGEPYSGTDWPSATTATDISWATTDFATDPNANALRWGTLYNFRFQANSPPVTAIATIGLFKPGTQSSLAILTQAPVTGVPAAVSNFACSVNVFDVNVTWTNGQTYDSILVYRDGEQVATLSGTATSYADTGLAVGSYVYEILPIASGVGAPQPSCTVDVLPPGNPTNLTCTATGMQIDLSWTNNDTYDQMFLFRDGALYQTLSPTATSFSDTGLFPATYEYSLIAEVMGVQTVALNCSAEVLPPPPLMFDLTVTGGTVPYDTTTGVGSVTATVATLEDPANMGFPNAISGFSLALGHDSTLLQAQAVTLSSAVQALNGGAGPEFQSSVVLADGVTSGVVFSYFFTASLPASTSLDLASVDYATNAATLAGNMTGATTALGWVDGVLGSPLAYNTITVDVQNIFPTTVDASVSLVPSTSVITFIRGDADAGGSVTIGDAVTLLDYMFVGTAVLTCLSAGDVNDDSGIDVSDAITVLDLLFGATTTLPTPYPACGVDGTTDALTCDSFAGCP